MTHLHITSWVLMIIFFLITYMNHTKSQGKGKGFVPMHMLTRVFMLLTLISGAYLFYLSLGSMPMVYGIKFLLGLIVLGLMEMTLAKKKKNKNAKGMLIATIVLIVITIALGSYLPMGIFHFG